MLKRTLFFSNPYYLSARNEQLVIQEKSTPRVGARTTPIEDLGFLVLDHPQITVSHTAFQKLSAHNVAVIICDEKHMPGAMLLSFNAHYEQTGRFRTQLETSEPLKKQLWKQTVEAKIRNQAQLMALEGLPDQPLQKWSREVSSGDTDNREGLAARYYWNYLFSPLLPDFVRLRDGFFPNNLLNYGYAIVRAGMARALAGAGLLVALGINHRNKYNPFCLADDMMEPYRPYVDAVVRRQLLQDGAGERELTIEDKKQMLQLLTIDVEFGNQTSPMMVGMSRTANSLVRCMEGTSKKLQFPVYQ